MSTKKSKGKYNIDIVRTIFEDANCTLISAEYKNTKTKLDYICECGKPSQIKLEKFIIGQRCRSCSYIKTANSSRLKYVDVRDYFKDNGCTLISESYMNANTPLDYICSCGRSSSISFSHFKNGVRCAECAGNEKYSYGYVKDYFESQNCKLISNEYINTKSKLDYVCVCGNTSEINFDSFKRGSRCKNCKAVKIGDSKRHSYEYVKSVFEEKGMTLLSDTYINIETPLDYICVCGHVGKGYLQHIESGGKCQECRKNLLSELFAGSNSYAYNPNLTEEDRMHSRNYPEYKSWRIAVFTKDSYMCQCCGSKNNINAHHKDGYHWCKERRVDVTNGTTLCSLCHFAFHSIYGRKNNTENQYSDFLELYQEQIINNKINIT